MNITTKLFGTACKTWMNFLENIKTRKSNPKLYQGTPYEVDVVFDGFKFATKGADSNNHYVMKRTTESSPDLGVVTGVYNDPFQVP